MSTRFHKFAACVVLFAVAALGSLPTAAYGQHGGGGHGGGGHGGFSGHGGFGGHGGYGHGGYGGYGHGGYGGYGHGGYGGGYGHGLYGGYGHSLYAGSGIGHYGGLSYGHYTPYYGYYYWPGYGHYGYRGLGYGSYGLYGSGLYGQSYTAAYRPTSDSSASVLSSVANSGEPRHDYLSPAENAFRSGDYAEAARLANHAVVETPRNGRLFLFVSQALFATGDYQGATAALYQATTLLEPKDWGYVVQNFRDYYRNNDYTTQVDRLTKFIKENPKAAYARTLRGYHYGFLGYKEPAERDLAKAVELEKRDKLASRLLEQFGGTAQTTPPATPPANPPKDTL